MTIINASFVRQSEAKSAVDALRGAGFDLGSDMPLAVDPEFEVDPTANTSPGAEAAGPGAVKGAGVGTIVGIAVGAATIPIAGPAAVAAGAGVGAFTGSLIGALEQLGSEKAPNDEEAGALIRIEVADAQSKARVHDILGEHHAANISEE